MKCVRTYADTSVFGGVFDEEFDVASRAFFDLVKRGRFELVVSDICRLEIEQAPSHVKEYFDGLLAYMHLAPVDEHVLDLRDAYLSAGVVGQRSLDDAAHVAAATVANVELIVSWNFRHMRRSLFDEEFDVASRAFFDLVKRGRFELVVSDICRLEIEQAPSHVKEYFDGLLAYMHLAPVDEHVLDLRDAYLSAGVVGQRSLDDAAHVAAATVADVELIVSWNFRHIVHFEKIRLYNAVNALEGYRSLEIRSPMEVLEYEDQDI